MIKIEWVMGLGSVCKTMHDNPGVVQIDYERWMDLPKDEKKAMLRQAYNLATDMQVNTALRKQGVKWIDIPMTNYPYEDMRGVPDLTDECPLCGNAETCKECEPPLKYAELKPIKAEVKGKNYYVVGWDVSLQRYVWWRDDMHAWTVAGTKAGRFTEDEAFTEMNHATRSHADVRDIKIKQWET